MTAIQSQTRGQIRRSIGKNLGIVVDGTVTATVSTSALTDTKNLIGGDDEFKDREVLVHTPTGSIVAGETSVVSAFVGSTNVATMAPVFTASLATGDQYEMWKTPWRIGDINDAINQAINGITGRALKVKEIHTPFTESAKYLYDVLSGFTHITKVEYVQTVGNEKIIDRCDVVWSELVDADVTASLDSTFYKEGGGSLKLVAADGLGAGDIMATQSLTSLDLSGCNEVQIWIHSSVALAAGDLQLLLDNTAQCASPVETLNIPATTANVWTRHIISLTNPYNDSAIISAGIKQVVDKGAFTLRVDDIKALDANSNVYQGLPSEYWSIAKGSTPYLQLTPEGLCVAGINTQLRLTGFQIVSRMDTDSTVSDLDPGWLISQVTGHLLISHAKSSYLDIDDRKSLSAYWLGEAAKKETSLSPSIPGGTRSVS